MVVVEAKYVGEAGLGVDGIELCGFGRRVLGRGGCNRCSKRLHVGRWAD